MNEMQRLYGFNTVEIPVFDTICRWLSTRLRCIQCMILQPCCNIYIISCNFLNVLLTYKFNHKLYHIMSARSLFMISICFDFNWYMKYGNYRYIIWIIPVIITCGEKSCEQYGLVTCGIWSFYTLTLIHNDLILISKCVNGLIALCIMSYSSSL